uniref:AAA family ATPase n=1 Tax=Anisakis simplex TaxID=6269 RepID=A0A0M3J7P2_ANISI
LDTVDLREYEPVDNSIQSLLGGNETTDELGSAVSEYERDYGYGRRGKFGDVYVNKMLSNAVLKAKTPTLCQYLTRTLASLTGRRDEPAHPSKKAQAMPDVVKRSPVPEFDASQLIDYARLHWDDTVTADDPT